MTDWYRGFERHLRHGSEDFFCLLSPSACRCLATGPILIQQVLPNAYKKDSVKGRRGSPTPITSHIRIHEYNNIRQRAKFMMPLTMQFSLACCYFFLLTSKYSPQDGKLQLSYLIPVRDAETACLIDATVLGRGLRGLPNDVNYR